MISNRLILGALLFFFSLSLIAQNKSFNLVPIEQKNNDILSKQFTKYHQYDFDIISLKNHVDNQKSVEPFLLSIPEIGDITIELHAYDLLAEDHLITTSTESGTMISKIDKNITYKGYTPQGPVRFTINKNYINGFITTKQGTFYIESATSLLIPDDFIVVYKDTDVIKSSNGGCAFSDKHLAQQNIDKDIASQKMAGDCYKVDLAIANDYSMYEKHGDVEAVINHSVSVMNNVAANYDYDSDTNFDDGVEFKIVEHFISACTNCDPWTNSTNVFTLFYNFQAWAGLDVGFVNDFKMAQLWTDRNFDGAYVGLANTNSDLFCNGFATHVLQDFTSNAAYLRVMTAHEIGHNFNGIHINTSGYIMSSSVNITDTWNTENKTRISTELVNQGPTCLASCGGAACSSIDDLEVSNISDTSFDISWSAQTPNNYNVSIYDEDTQDLIYSSSTSSNTMTLSPTGYGICENYRVEVFHICSSGNSPSTVVLFESPKSQGCADFCPSTNIQWSDNMIDFQDESENAVSWLWDFGDGNTSSLQSPSHLYDNAGFYDVTLTVNGGMHEMTYDSIVAILPDRTLPYQTTQGGSFDTPTDDFAAMGLNDTDNIWERGVATGTLNSNSNVWKTDLDGNVGNQKRESLLYTPRFDFSGTATYILKFDMSMEIQFCNAPVAMQLQYSTNMGNTWTRLGSHGDSGGYTQNWYNRGPGSSCPISTQVFADETGWTFNGLDIETSYDVSFLSGNDEVIFRFFFAAVSGYSSGYEVDGVMIDNFEIEVEGVVPVTITDFNGLAKGTSNELNWQTEQAINFDHFVVERSNDGRSFIEMVQVNGKEGMASYNTTDNNPYILTYYRLKMMDRDGSYTYSDIISILNERDKISKPQFFPNPNISGKLFLKDVDDVQRIDIVDATGKVVFQSVVKTKTIDINDLAIGVYMIRFFAEGKLIESSKLVRI